MGLLLTVATSCRDGVGPEGLRYARVAVAPVLPSDAQIAAFGLAIDRVRIIVVRPSAPPDTLADTTVDMPPDAEALDLNLRVPIVTSPESVTVSIVALSGTIPLFEGTAPVEVSAGLVSEPTEIPVDTYVGPGSGVDSIVISPRTSFIYFGDSLRYQVLAFQGGTPVTQFYVSWTTSDTALAKVNGAGTLRAPRSRNDIWVVAHTPSGVSDSVVATFQPFPTQLVPVSGNGQSGTIGAILPVPLAVEVRAADNLPVAGVAVRFRALSGGSPADTTVITDSLGHASVTGILGSGAGAQSFQATIPSFPAVTAAVFGATASSGAISPAQSVISVSTGSVQSGNTVTLTLQGKDGGGSNLTSGGATVVFGVSGGTSTGTISPSPATDNGNGTYTATFTGVLAGTASTVGATINSSAVTSTPPTLTVTPGAISVARSVISVSAATILSGDSTLITLQAKDNAGNSLTTGGQTVAFTTSVGPGISTGTIGATTDHGDGSYTARFTAVLAGTGTTINATINALPVTSIVPTIVVTPGAISPVTSLLTTSSSLLTSGASATLTLQAKDAAGNDLTTGGATVTFADSGGTSTGSISATTDHANGTYTALFTAIAAGSATTIQARIGATRVNSAASINVLPGNSAAAQSIVNVSADSVLSGGAVTLTLQARDSLGNTVMTGGSTVVFSVTGGTSTGTIAPSPATDHGNGTYTATLTGVLAGTPVTVHATLDGAAVTSTLPAVKVLPGPISATTSVLSVSSGTVLSGAVVSLGLRGKDAAGNSVTVGGATVAFSFAGGTSTGSIGTTVDSANGKYTAPFTGLVAGSATTINATVNGTPVGTSLPTILVSPGATASVAVTPAADTVAALGLTRQFTAQAHDAHGNLASDSFTWASSLLAVAKVDSTGKATSSGDGAATITATAVSNGTAGTATLLVAQIVTTVKVTPATDTLTGIGLTKQFTAQALDASDSLVPGKTFVWNSSNPPVATV
ncbi:MAG TPA: invasin domain 3-containing protein, partial [Gemmatimonadales bacterium]|nr:invasin domain 3-containing protein [Gemmatimonadales bacterium]